jgi:hypothetical protein
MGQAVYGPLNGVGCTGTGLYANGLPHASELLLAMVMTSPLVPAQWVLLRLSE